MSRAFRAAIAAVAVAVAVASPARAAGFPTTDGQFSGVGVVGAGGVLNLTVTGRGGVPASGVDAVALNVTVTNPTAASYLTVWPTGQPRPTASNLNYVAGTTAPNMVIAKVGDNGQISLFNLAGTTDVVVDVLGWFPTGGAFTSLTPARLLDTRVVPPPPPPRPPTVLTFRPGTVLVNSTMPPGRYVAQAKTGCYWERLAGLSGSFSDVITNDFQSFTGRAIVDIKATDVAFKFDSDCGNFSTYVPSGSPWAFIGPGAHVVGSDILPGTYQTTASSGCYWERVRGFGGSIADVITNDFVADSGTQYVTIATSDVGFSSDVDCGTWVRL